MWLHCVLSIPGMNLIGVYMQEPLVASAEVF